MSPALPRGVPDPAGSRTSGRAVASPARIYSYLLGGRDYFPADLAAAENALSAVPHVRVIARANRRFVARAVRYMAGQGIAQFLDLGAGLPARPAVHDVARSVVPGARVLYVDSDPSVTAQYRGRSAGCDGIAVVHGDIREPYGIFASPEIDQLIDFDQPLGLLLTAVLHFIPPEDDPESSIQTFAKYLAPGSCLAVSHVTSDGTHPSVITAIQDACKAASALAAFRTADQIRGFFAGLDLVAPGLTDVTSWPGRMPAPPQSPALRVLAGVARSPARPAPG
jgi:S-adenosyl methyltransferase